MTFAAKLESFEGPLDLLLHLIEKEKVDIYDIPIARITDQYLAYLDQMEEQDANVMSEFLVMAATLLDIKARMLLPAEVDEEGNEEDPRDELVQQLLEYKMYKYMSRELKDMNLNAAKNLYKQPTIPEEVAEYEAPIDLDVFLEDVTLAKMKEVFDDVIRRCTDRTNTEAIKFGRIRKDEIKIEDRITRIRTFLKREKKFSFRSLIEQQGDKMNVIVSFLAVLEMMKDGTLKARQADNDADIILYDPSIEEDENE